MKIQFRPHQRGHEGVIMNYPKALTVCGAVIIASAAIGAVASPADAKSRTVVVEAISPDQPTQRVSFRDLNLVLASDQIRLNRRVGGAVSNVCNEHSTSAAPFLAPACKSYAWNGAKPQISAAIQRAQEIAATGKSSIVAAAITITFPR